MRQFLAARLPDPVREEVASLQARVSPALRGWRWLRPEGIHLTLRFLGEVEPDLDARGRELWGSAITECLPFHIRLTGLGCFPPRGQPRVLWVGIEETEPGGALAALAARLETAARELGFAAESRPFRPHLTLARRARSGPTDTPDSLRENGAADGWVREVVLHRSELKPTGARYTALRTFPLTGETPGA